MIQWSYLFCRSDHLLKYLVNVAKILPNVNLYSVEQEAKHKNRISQIIRGHIYFPDSKFWIQRIISETIYPFLAKICTDGLWVIRINLLIPKSKGKDYENDQWSYPFSRIKVMDSMDYLQKFKSNCRQTLQLEYSYNKNYKNI